MDVNVKEIMVMVWLWVKQGGSWCLRRGYLMDNTNYLLPYWTLPSPYMRYIIRISNRVVCLCGQGRIYSLWHWNDSTYQYHTDQTFLHDSVECLPMYLSQCTFVVCSHGGGCYQARCCVRCCHESTWWHVFDGRGCRQWTNDVRIGIVQRRMLLLGEEAWLSMMVGCERCRCHQCMHM